MPISKRTLTKWRKEALNVKATLERAHTTTDPHHMFKGEYANRILLLTAELLDQQLLKEK